MKYSIDRFEGEFAVLLSDAGERCDIPRSTLPDGVREGSILERTEGGWRVLVDETNDRRLRLIARRNKLLGGTK